MASTTMSSSVQVMAAGLSTTGMSTTTWSAGVSIRSPFPADGLVVGSPGDEDDVPAVSEEEAAENPTDGAGTVDDEPHRLRPS